MGLFDRNNLGIPTSIYSTSYEAIYDNIVRDKHSTVATPQEVRNPCEMRPGHAA